MVTKEEFESRREKLILEGSLYPNCLKALGVFEGLLEITYPIKESCTPSDYNPDTQEDASLLRLMKRKFKDRILDIQVDESISHYMSHLYSLRVSMMLLNEEKDPRPGCEIPTLTLGRGGMNFSYIEKNVDDAITLLKIYRSAMQTEAYGKREKQIEPLKKILKGERGIIANV